MLFGDECEREMCDLCKTVGEPSFDLPRSNRAAIPAAVGAARARTKRAEGRASGSAGEGEGRECARSW